MSVSSGSQSSGSQSRGSTSSGSTSKGRALASGPGRVLVSIYAVFALAAGARASVQIATKFDQARLAYLLSALAAVIYLVATIGFIRGGAGGRRLAIACCSVELLGVLAVGTASVVGAEAFPDETVWSGFGRGYGFVPLVLPVLGLLWLRAAPATRANSGPRPLDHHT